MQRPAKGDTEMKCGEVNMGQRRAMHFDHSENYIIRVKTWVTAKVYLNAKMQKDVCSEFQMQILQNVPSQYCCKYC